MAGWYCGGDGGDGGGDGEGVRGHEGYDGQSSMDRMLRLLLVELSPHGWLNGDDGGGGDDVYVSVVFVPHLLLHCCSLCLPRCRHQ